MRTSWGGSLDRRATELRKEILRFTDNFNRWSRIHIIAHSMGGLDARWMIYKFKMSDQVASLTTIGTPHHGTAYADWALKYFGRLFDFATTAGLDLQGVKSLSRAACKGLNELLAEFEEKNGVIYRTIAGVQPMEQIFLSLRPSYRIIWQEEGENDGLVSLRSAMWKKEYFLDQIDADHLNQIGWWDGGRAMGTTDKANFEKRILEVYLDIVRTLP